MTSVTEFFLTHPDGDGDRTLLELVRLQNDSIIVVLNEDIHSAWGATTDPSDAKGLWVDAKQCPTVALGQQLREWSDCPEIDSLRMALIGETLKTAQRIVEEEAGMADAVARLFVLSWSFPDQARSIAEQVLKNKHKEPERFANYAAKLSAVFTPRQLRLTASVIDLLSTEDPRKTALDGVTPPPGF